MNKFTVRAKKALVLTALFAALAYALLLSPGSGVLDRRAEADNLGITDAVMQYVNRYYVDKSAVEPKSMLMTGLNKMEQVVDKVLVEFPDEENSASFKVQAGGVTETFDLSGVRSLNDVTDRLEQVFTFVSPNLTPNDPKINDIEYAVLDQILNSLDPHSGIITPQVYKEFMIETEGSFGGLGIVIGVRDSDLTVISPIEGTPAYRAGIESNDKIVQIGSESTINMSLIEAVGKLRGPKGTEVSIHIMRDGFPAPREYKLVRDTIVIESVETFNLDDGIEYIRIRDFQKNTLDSIISNIRRDGVEDPKGIILDLRGNPGGLLDQAERISDLFLKSGVIVTTKIGNSSKRYHANDKDQHYNGRIVVLVDAGSASASEIVAGALKNNERAIVIGERTFGKGSVQQIFDLNDGSALKLTIAQYLTPGDESIQDVGVTPDIILNPAVITDDTIVYHPNSDDTIPEKPWQKKKKTVDRVLEKPVYSITYLDNTKAPKSGEDGEAEQTPEEALSREEKRKKLEEDFYVSLAREIINSSSARSRKESLGELREDIDKITKSEEGKIVDKWKLMGVDWSSEKTAGSKPSLAVTITPDFPSGSAGEKIGIDVEVENAGKEPLYRLLATTKSENAVFEGKELIFGKVEPGEKRSWKTTFEIPKWALTREDWVTLKFEDGNASKIPDYKFPVNTRGLERPLYAYNYEIVDDGRYESNGNGNGVPEPGEIIAFVAKVKNIGRGASEKTILTLKNNSGDKIFLEKGRAEFADLKPGDSTEAAFTFDVNNTDSPLDLELQIVDDVFKEGLIGKALVPGNTDGAVFRKMDGTVTVAEADTPVRGASYKEAPITALSGRGASFTVIGESGDWIKIKLNEDSAGWISKDKTVVSESAGPGQPEGVTLLKETFEAPPVIKVAGVPVTTESGMITISGNVSDKDGVELVSVYVGDDKVALLPSTKTEVPFSVNLKLRDDINLITIVAKDSKGLLSKQSFVIRKDEEVVRKAEEKG